MFSPMRITHQKFGDTFSIPKERGGKSNLHYRYQMSWNPFLISSYHCTILYHSVNNLLLSPSDYILFLIAHFPLVSSEFSYKEETILYIKSQEESWLPHSSRQMTRRVFPSYYHHMTIFYLLIFKTSNLSKFRAPHKIKGMISLYSQLEDIKMSILMDSTGMVGKYVKWFFRIQILS